MKNFNCILVTTVMATIYSPVYGEPYKITVLFSEYSDGAGASCNPDLSICNGRTACAFEVSDSLCSLGPEAGPARNLEVHYACGVPLPDKATAAARGTRISIDCSR